MANHRALKALAGALLLVWAAPPAPAAEPDVKVILKRFLTRVFANDSSMQNYTCVETVRRDYFQPAASTLPRSCTALLAARQHPTPDLVLKLQSTDRLRLDVASVRQGEIFSWAGASRFDDSNIDQVVREGPIGSGAFGAFLGVIFEKDAKTLNYAGMVILNGRGLAEFNFAVAQEKSHYMVRLMDGGRTASAYSGSVLVDPETGDPVHLTVRTNELPEATGSCASIADLDYQRVKIGDRELLLPASARQRFISRNGRETENSTTFASCREYVTESTVNFYQDPEPAATAVGKVTAAAPTVPAGLRLVFELTGAIETDTAAVGDQFAGRLTEPLRDGRQVLAPKGAVVEGRITTMQIGYLPSPTGLVGLSPRRIEIKGVKTPLSALPDSRTVIAAGKKSAKRGFEIFLPPRGEFSGIFHFKGAASVFRRGFVSEWVTAVQPRHR